MQITTSASINLYWKLNNLYYTKSKTLLNTGSLPPRITTYMNHAQNYILAAYLLLLEKGGKREWKMRINLS